MSDKAITRLQKFLRLLVDESAYMPEPLKILEKACCYACGRLDTMPKPVTRTEKLIASVRDKSIVPPTPVTRLEKYIAAIAGYYTDDLPEPVTREDKILFDLACGEDVTLSGNPLVLENSVGKPLKECVISWEPTQAGSGEPYPAGGGPNLLDISKCTAGFKPYGLTTAISGELLTIKGTASTTSAGASFVVAMTPDTSLSGKGYKVTAFPAKGSITSAYGLRTADEKAIAVLMPLTEGAAVDVALRIMVSKDTPTAYAPYENIRPISGRESVKVQHSGENLLKITPFAKTVKNSVTFEYIADGGVRIEGTSTASTDSPTFPAPILAPGKYYGVDVGTGIAASIVVTRDGKLLWMNAKKTFEILAGDITHYWYMIVNKGTTANKTVYPYIVPGSTPPTVYTPYRGYTLALALPSTICGGTVDAATGEGAETWKLVTLDGTEAWNTRTTIASGGYISYSLALPVRSLTGICSHYKSLLYATIRPESPTGETGCYLEYSMSAIFNVPFETVAEWKSYLAAQYAAGTPVQIAYKLAEPVPFQATGNGEITTFKGTNTLITDADEITATYKCNVKAAEKTVNEIYEQCLQEVEDIQNDSKTLQTSD